MYALAFEVRLKKRARSVHHHSVAAFFRCDLEDQKCGFGGDGRGGGSKFYRALSLLPSVSTAAALHSTAALLFQKN